MRNSLQILRACLPSPDDEIGKFLGISGETYPIALGPWGLLPLFALYGVLGHFAGRGFSSSEILFLLCLFSKKFVGSECSNFMGEESSYMWVRANGILIIKRLRCRSLIDQLRNTITEVELKIALIFLGQFEHRRGMWEGLRSREGSCIVREEKRTLTAIEPKGGKHLRKTLILTKPSTDDHPSVIDIWLEIFCGNRAVNSPLGH